VTVTRVVLALEEHDVAEEVMHFLDRSGHTHVVATAADDRQLAEAVRQLDPDAVIARPALIRSGSLDGRALFAIETQESVGALRAAIRAGARGYYVWPGERQELAAAVAASGVSIDEVARRALVVSVFAPRGGSGATFVATHLAAAFARRRLECFLVDADVVYADVTAALGAYGEGEMTPRNIADLVSLFDETDGTRLGEALWRHSEGFGVLLGPDVARTEDLRPDAVRRALDAAARSSDVVVTHLPRSLDSFARPCVEFADRTIAVLSLDVFSFRAARRALETLPVSGVDLVVNRARRAEVTPSDVSRVFGREPIAVLPYDRSVPTSQDHGRLLPPKSRMGRAFDRLAARLWEDRA
jgi:Flp pilus assembly CpaE family ATPase